MRAPRGAPLPLHPMRRPPAISGSGRAWQARRTTCCRRVARVRHGPVFAAPIRVPPAVRSSDILPILMKP